MSDEPIEQYDDSSAAAEAAWMPPPTRTSKPGVSGTVGFVGARDRDEKHTGMLAPQPEPFAPALRICWPADISEERRAQISANPAFMRYLAAQPPHEQIRQIFLWRPPVDPAVEARLQAEREAARQRRQAELAALPTHEELCRLVRTLEAKLIEQGVRIAELEDAQPRKPARVSRIADSPPRPAA